MKHIFLGIMSITFFVSIRDCTSDEVEPLLRIRNERADNAHTRIQVSGGDTISINNIQSGQTTAYQVVPEGAVIATALVQDETASSTTMFFVGRETRFTVVIQKGDTLSVRVDQ